MSKEINRHSHQLAKFIGQRLREAREALQWTPERAAASCDISAEFYERLERGLALPSVRILFDLSTHLGVTPDYMLGSYPTEHQKLLAELTDLLPLASSEDLAVVIKHLKACVALCPGRMTAKTSRIYR